MLKMIGMEFKQFIRTPLWSVIFAVTIVAAIFLPRSSLTDLSVVPGLVYFMMVMSLIFSIYGAEIARIEINNHSDEPLAVTPKYAVYHLSKLMYWLALSATIYFLFYVAVMGYIGIIQNNITKSDIRGSLIYTLLCWFIPFFYSIILGYIVYRTIPGIYSYIIIIFLWFLTMPYNSMLGFIPQTLGGWLINGDPNIILIFSSSPLESLEINKGFYLQRGFMFLLLISAYSLVIYRRDRKYRFAAIVTMVLSLLIPTLSPFVPYITGSDMLGPAALKLTDESKLNTDYKVHQYTFHLKHGESNHHFRYTVDMDIESQSDQISLALLEDFHILSASLNEQPVATKRLGNVVQLEIAERIGTLHMEVETQTYQAIGPTTLQLIATTAWYPMNPLEARDPYTNGVKENYEIYWDSAKPNRILSNLDHPSESLWTGIAFGPTLLMGEFDQEDDIVFPSYKTFERIQRIQQGLEEIFQDNNKKYAASEQLPPHLYYVTTFYGMQANPDEAYIYPNVYPNEDILRVFYPQKR
ncbi:hypothetical protein [uncultured Paenibacillus sp.]|uniref:hypothetical protein n=1 Tax=uncultured Paenibacillus sp. TaxID=227322 RepID=UPI0015A8AB41|nr:hypothetical protein [uncultured Paenibacillus sp.]